jgi:hypothetical protein
VHQEGEVTRHQAVRGEWDLTVSPAERRTWRIQHFGWLLMALIATGGLLGAFGGGPLAQREARSDHFTLRWPRDARLGTPARFTIQSTASQDTLFVTLGQGLLDGMSVREWQPEPAHSRISDSGITATFALRTRDSATVHVTLIPERIGSHRGPVGVDAKQVAASLFVLP